MASGQSDITEMEQCSAKGTLRGPSSHHAVQYTGPASHVHATLTDTCCAVNKITACRAALLTLTLLHPSVYAPHRFNCHCSFNFEQVNLVRRADLSFANGNLCACICCERTAQWGKKQLNISLNNV